MEAHNASDAVQTACAKLLKRLEWARLCLRIRDDAAFRVRASAPAAASAAGNDTIDLLKRRIRLLHRDRERMAAELEECRRDQRAGDAWAQRVLEKAASTHNVVLRLCEELRAAQETMRSLAARVAELEEEEAGRRADPGEHQRSSATSWWQMLGRMASLAGGYPPEAKTDTAMESATSGWFAFTG